MVQLEVKYEDEWKPVIRYDSAHNFAHKDTYTINGNIRKINLYMDYNDALTFADEDINDNWVVYRERFLRGDFP